MKVIIVLFLLIIFFLAGAGFTYLTAEKRFDANLANILLHELSNDVRLSGIIDTRNPETQNINLQLNKNIMETILSLSVIDPDPQILDSISLETLCLVTEMNSNGHFSQVVISGAEGMVLAYLKKIEEPISKEISQLQKLFKGTGCSTTIARP